MQRFSCFQEFDKNNLIKQVDDKLVIKDFHYDFFVVLLRNRI